MSFWRVASDEINYRRFFDVNELAALSMEREDVFRAVHRKWIGWVADGLADGLRIDHPDGLFDPKQYLDRLQSYYQLAVAERAGEEPTPSPSLKGGAQDLRSPDASGGSKEASRAVTPLPSGRGVGCPLYVVVEKILGDGEALPADWVCDGTAGYEFTNAVNGLFVDPGGEPALTDVYQRFTGHGERFADAAHDGKMQILSSSLASELLSLSHQLDRLARLDRRSRDFTLNGIRRALREVIACFPVYRSYVNGGASPTDKAAVGRAVHRARKRNPTLGKSLFDFIRNTVLLADPPDGPAGDEYRALQRRFAGKFQQVTAPVTAKGVEDTALYVYNRLGSLNEVGGEPARFGWAPERLHAFLAERGRTQPGGLCPLSTHDTKRSEDVRARLNVLSELPEEWGAAVARWADRNRRHKAESADADPAPDANEEWLLYQTLVGAWDGPPTPEFVARIQAYMKKALAEAKVHSSWINPDTDYEDEVAGFVQKVLDPAVSGAFLADLTAFAERVAAFGRVNSLAQTVIRCTVPGVPDTYQGTELWDLSLVDPDNRRPVDYDTRVALLAEIDAARQRRAGAAGWPWTCQAAERPAGQAPGDGRGAPQPEGAPALFADGAYVPLTATGERANHVFAFARVLGDQAAVVAVPRLVAKLVPGADRPPLGRKVWGDTMVTLPPDIPHGRYRNALTGERLSLSDDPIEAAELFGVFPVAVYVRE
ncbi:malto-oligosyltrehalose synthase [Frigoriglobus tundricola]|uniref:malto-oligosyltrehalose synthase n=1 Tax=Frigoriglobus tundricola TaxID=2774151 RepID=UPI0021BC473A|nr:malto-oligosyltrehalose synthase [Frigoriglobus tundricola]